MRLKYFLYLLAIIVVSCTTVHSDNLIKGSNNLANALDRNESATTHITKVIPNTNGEDKYNLESAKDDLTNQKSDIKGGQNSLLEEGKLNESLTNQLTKLNNKWYVIWGKRIELIFYSLLGALALGFILRVLSQTLITSGPVGTALAWGSTAIFGVLTGGVSLIQKWFDAHWVKMNAAPVPDPSKVSI